MREQEQSTSTADIGVPGAMELLNLLRNNPTGRHSPRRPKLHAMLSDNYRLKLLFGADVA